MTVVTTLDVHGMSPEEYRAVMDELGVEHRPESGIYMHATITTDFGYRIVEIWDRREASRPFSRSAWPRRRRRWASTARPR